MEEPGWRRPSPGGTGSPPPGLVAPVTDTGHRTTTTTHTRTHTHTLTCTLCCPKASSWGTPPSPVRVCVGLPEFPRGPVLRQQHEHRGLFGSLSVLSFSGSVPPTPPHGLQHPTPAFSTPLGKKFGGFFCIFEVFCTRSPAPPCQPSPSVLTWKEILHLCLL